MIRHQWNSLSTHQRAVLAASAVIAVIAVLLSTITADPPNLFYRRYPPVLSGDDFSPAFGISFLFLGRQPLEIQPGKLPVPGLGDFSGTFSGKDLNAGSIAEVYARSTVTTQPDYMSILEVITRLPNGGIELRYRTYSRTCSGS